MRKLEDKTVYVVGGHQATGTSMMMRVMIFGGIDGIYDDKFASKVLDTLNNPYGVFEGGWRKKEPEELVGKVFKCLGMSWRTIPEEYPIKMIKMCRDTEDIVNSRKRRMKKMAEKRGKELKRDGHRLPAFIDRMKEKFDEEFAKRKNIEKLDVNFNDLIKNPEKECKRIAKFVAPRDFDWKKAATAVDKTLKHD